MGGALAFGPGPSAFWGSRGSPRGIPVQGAAAPSPRPRAARPRGRIAQQRTQPCGAPYLATSVHERPPSVVR